MISFRTWTITPLIIVLLCLSSAVQPLQADDKKDQAAALESARGVLSRTLGQEQAKGIKLKLLDQPNDRNHSVYQYSAENGVLTVSGSSAVAICKGVYTYLRENNIGTVGWAGPRLNLADRWPDAPLTRGSSPFKIRHCYNVCTFGYTTAYWTWERWEQELDWLAMHGFNMIMAPVATEAIATRVWKELGLTQEEIDSYYTGPAHLPWNRMGNIRQVGGTLTDTWHSNQLELQHKLLKRMRELGIEPVIQGFAGFVPPAITRLHPSVKLHLTNWGGSSWRESQRPVVMLPDDPLFTKITKAYLDQWRKEFGDVRYVLVDSFNEMKLPATSTSPAEQLAGYGRLTYSAITSAIPDAVWVLQGWMFNYQRDIWNTETVKALLEAVPDDRLLVLDYANDYKPNWKDFSGFHGKTWVMGYVPNMGGKTAYTGRMDYYASQAAETLADPNRGALTGFTISGEGLENNEVLYELMADTAWSTAPIDLKPWLNNYVENRYGSKNSTLQDAWHDLHKSVYSSFTDHPTFGWQKMHLGRGSVYGDPAFENSVRKFLSVAPEMGENANYVDDAVEMAALVLSLKADDWFSASAEALREGDYEVFRKTATRANDLLLEADQLLASHSLHRLDRWIKLSRAHEGSPEQKDRWESNARQIITTWGPPVNDYSCRMWSGLIRDFYAPRMQAMLAAMREGEPFDRHTWEAKWVSGHEQSKVQPHERPAEVAKLIVERACTEKIPLPDTDAKLLARWNPAHMKTEWTTVDFEIPADSLKKMKGVRFRFRSGSHRLDVRSVSVIADGELIAIDRHVGVAGDSHRDNSYKLKMPAHIQANNSCLLRVELRSAGGTNSNGDILLQQ